MRLFTWLLACSLSGATPHLWAQQYHSSKISDGLSGPCQPQHIRVWVADTAAFLRWLHSQMPRTQASYHGQGIYTLAEITATDIARLTGCPAVQAVDVGPRQATPERALQVADFNLNRIEAVQRHYPAITGQGFHVSIKEDPFDSVDIDFKGRVLPSAVFALPQTTHATTMATLIGGGGNSGPLSKGVAPAVLMTSSSFANLLPDANNTLLQVSTQNHSYGVGVESFYGIEALAYDQQCVALPHLLHVFSAGNAGTQAAPTGTYAGLASWANLTGQFKQSKNTLSVGGTNSQGTRYTISSRGPAHDGRLKPELVAIGDNGTSEAAAMVSGTALLLQHAYFDQTAQPAPSYLNKAVLINSADDAGVPLPDYSTGYGQLDALGAVRTIVQNRFVLDSIAQGQTLNYPIVVPAGVGQLRATLTWLDPPAAANATQALVHDLHLQMLHPASSTTYLPWVLSPAAHADSLARPAVRAVDTLNNVEHISIDQPTAGTYTLRVSGTRVSGRQAFAIAYEYETGLAWDYPVRGSVLTPSTTQLLRWRGGSTATAELHYRTLGGSWQLITDTLALATGRYGWLAPGITAPVQLRLRVGLSETISDTFLLAAPLTANIGFNCSQDALLQWNNLPQADSFVVYRLGAQTLQALTTTTDSFFVINKNSNTALHYAVAPWLGGVRGPLSYTLNYTTQGVACYVRGWVAEQPVAIRPTLLLQLGSTYQLAQIQWQRLVGAEFQTLQTITAPTQLDYSFVDTQPQLGANQYRVVITTQSGEQSSSNIETVQNLNTQTIWAYPNPAPAGGVWNLTTVDEEAARIRVLNMRGQVLWQTTTDAGQVKELRPPRLQAGTYVVQVTSSTGSTECLRMVVY